MSHDMANLFLTSLRKRTAALESLKVPLLTDQQRSSQPSSTDAVMA